MSSASKKLLRELPTVREMNLIIASLKNFSPQTTTIMGAAYLEHALESLIRVTFRSLPKKEDNDRLYNAGAGGALGTFTSKIRISFSAFIIDREVHDALLLINDIRNVFAHSLHLIDFSNEFVAADCGRLREVAPTIANAAGLLPLPGNEDPLEVYSRFVSMLYRSLRLQVAVLKEPPPEEDDLELLAGIEARRQRLELQSYEEDDDEI